MVSTVRAWRGPGFSCRIEVSKTLTHSDKNERLAVYRWCATRYAAFCHVAKTASLLASLPSPHQQLSARRVHSRTNGVFFFRCRSQDGRVPPGSSVGPSVAQPAPEGAAESEMQTTTPGFPCGILNTNCKRFFLRRMHIFHHSRASCAIWQVPWWSSPKRSGRHISPFGW